MIMDKQTMQKIDVLCNPKLEKTNVVRLVK